MSFVHMLREAIAPWNLLQHPFYQDWTMGRLSLEDLRHYAKAYRPHVDAFPRYVSAVHSLCESAAGRQALLENLIDEERGSENHPELWLRFGEGVGLERDELLASEATENSGRLVGTFFELCRKDYASGLGALYAYEHQIPSIAPVKIEGLEKNYEITDDRATKFFEVHREADVYHTQAIEAELEALGDSQQDAALCAARTAAQGLWDFLSGVQAEAAAIIPR